FDLLDWDQDGALDVVMARSGVITLLMNNGAGELVEGISSAGAIGPCSVRGEDLDNDGDVDVVVSSSNVPALAKVTLVFNDGLGGVDRIEYVLPGMALVWCEPVDIDLDGDRDLVALAHDTGVVAVLRNQGGGTFAPLADYYLGARGNTLVVEDVSHDGLPDVVLASDADSRDVFVLFAQGGGALGQPTRFPATDGSLSWRPSWHDTGDYDNDGRTDVLTCGAANSSHVAVLLNEGVSVNTVLAPAGQVDTPANALVVTDLSQDATPDLAVTKGPNKVASHDGAGDGTFGDPTFSEVGSDPSAVAAADLDGDGKPELVVADRTGVTVLPGNGDPARSYVAGLLPSAVALGDLNGDGWVDVVMGDAAATAVVMLNNGVGVLTAPLPIPGAICTHGAALADLNSDGALDLVLGETNQVSVRLGVGNGTFGPATNHAIGPATHGLAVADLNGDGALDLALASSDKVARASNVWVLLGDGSGAFGLPTPVHTVAGATLGFLAAGDLDRDGAADLVLARGGTLTVLTGNGDATFAAPVDTALPGESSHGIALADLNGDAVLDAAVAQAEAGVAVLLGAHQCEIAAPEGD
ncbi:VCBS repeat-containing protein, partial [Planctomycetota bacterium]|nr:VCBS repeat-containing protein [Planctomycetota bacterium]